MANPFQDQINQATSELKKLKPHKFLFVQNPDIPSLKLLTARMGSKYETYSFKDGSRIRKDINFTAGMLSVSWGEHRIVEASSFDKAIKDIEETAPF